MSNNPSSLFRPKSNNARENRKDAEHTATVMLATATAVRHSQEAQALVAEEAAREEQRRASWAGLHRKRAFGRVRTEVAWLLGTLAYFLRGLPFVSLVDGRLRLTWNGHVLRLMALALSALTLVAASGLLGVGGVAAMFLVAKNPTARSAFALIGYYPVRMQAGANDGARIAAAVAAAGAAAVPGGTIYFAPGPYVTTATVNVTDLSNFEIEGPGATIVCNDGDVKPLQLLRCSNWTVSGIGVSHSVALARMTGFGINVLSSTDGRIIGVRTTGVCGMGIRITHNSDTMVASERITVQGCIIGFNGADGIHCGRNCRSITITGNSIVQPGDDGVAIFSTDVGDVASTISVTGNTIVGGGPLNGGRGVAVVGCGGCSVTGNTIDAVACAGLYCFRDTANSGVGSADVVFAGNVVTNANQRDTVSYNDITIGGGGHADPVTRVLIRDNLCYNGRLKSCSVVGTSTAFTVAADTDVPTGKVADTFTDNSHGRVNGERVTLTALSGATGVTTGTGYFVRDATANTFKLAATSGGAAIDITSDGSGEVLPNKSTAWVTIKDNVFISGPRTTNTVSIYITSCGWTEVSDNIVAFSQSTGILVDPDVGECYIRGNFIYFPNQANNASGGVWGIYNRAVAGAVDTYSNKVITDPTKNATTSIAADNFLVDSVNNRVQGTSTISASRTLSKTDISRLGLCTAALTLILPKDTTEPLWLVGHWAEFKQEGAGQITFAPEDGTVTIHSVGNRLKSANQWSVVAVQKTAANEYSVYGETA